MSVFFAWQRWPYLALAPAASGAESLPGSGEGAPIKVLVAMSAELERMAWGIIIAGQSDMQLIAQVSSCDEVQSILKTERSDVTVVDEAVMTNAQFKALQRHSKQPSSSRFVLVTSHPLDDSLEQSWHAFADAHLLKGVSAAELLRTIRMAASRLRA